MVSQRLSQGRLPGLSQTLLSALMLRGKTALRYASLRKRLHRLHS
jgi:hypothetical protein